MFRRAGACLAGPVGEQHGCGSSRRRPRSGDCRLVPVGHRAGPPGRGRAREAASRQVSTTAAGLLDVNLADVLVAAWRKHKDLTAAARRTLAAPGSTELVDLASHRVTATQEPYISILVDGHRVAAIRFELSLVFDVSALLAEIHAGRLAALHSGRCGVTGALAVQGIEAVSRQAHLDLPGIIPLRQGIRLLPADDYPAAEGTHGSSEGSVSAAIRHAP